MVAPHPLPRMDFSEGLPSHVRTLVVVPTMLGSAVGVESLIEALEVRFLANRDANLHFGLLTDFRDAPGETAADDLPLIDWLKSPKSSEVLQQQSRLNRYQLKSYLH